MPKDLLRPTDLRGAARLTTDAVLGLTGLVEALHARIASLPTTPGAEQTGGLTGLVYKTVRGVTRVVGGSAEALLGWLGPALLAPEADATQPEREALIAALNGVLGDHLAATRNPLAIQMSLRTEGRALALDPAALRARLPGATPRVLVLLHGLCMNDLQWRHDQQDHGQTLAREAGYTSVYLHYNTGLHIADNGRQLAALLEQLVQAWPVPIERLVLLGHSMGGLVARSALHQTEGQPSLSWPGLATHLVCLGTPHLGAPLERIGHGVDQLLGATPYAAPLARLGKVRSAGITDLRHGSVTAPGDDGPHPTVPLPTGVRCYTVAAHLGPETSSVKSRLLGDGLVPLNSALGHHRDPARRLLFPPDHQAIVPDTGHLELLSSAAVAGHLMRWLRGA
ncbi:alpha/beta hydrolase [Roseateles paludis]|jgi:pimeloyl-ACP methyl ester carboxylesterase|uniref:Alpha/beta hydrolase n=1 Tax=Roseateles paludis TaxID=3145238 RepID=A0ABV0FZG1_9BURK